VYDGAVEGGAGDGVSAGEGALWVEVVDSYAHEAMACPCFCSEQGEAGKDEWLKRPHDVSVLERERERER
jgi:hypothetical protein